MEEMLVLIHMSNPINNNQILPLSSQKLSEESVEDNGHVRGIRSLTKNYTPEQSLGTLFSINARA
jgi:hypothetical protein